MTSMSSVERRCRFIGRFVAGGVAAISVAAAAEAQAMNAHTSVNDGRMKAVGGN
jgi:hypothetical protein